MFIIGLGVVGNAVYQYLKLNGINCGGYDKFKNVGSLEDSLNFDMTMLCLPTQYSRSSSEYHKEPIYEICQYLSDNNYKGLVIVKSTVEPGTCQSLADKYNLHILHNPEFLSAATALHDFKNQNHIVVGKTNNCDVELVNKYVELCKKLWTTNVSLCSSSESESMKIFCNNFYSVKIQIFNEFYLMCKNQGIDYDRVLELMLKNNWINPMHTAVPGTDGQLSYGGMCFPKDTNALLQHMKRLDTPHKVLESVVTERDEFRKDNINVF
jgi:UDPglucose 6-dehydrogenase